MITVVLFAGSCGGTGPPAAPGIGGAASRTIRDARSPAVGLDVAESSDRRDPTQGAYKQVRSTEFDGDSNPSEHCAKFAMKLHPLLWAGLLPVLPYAVPKIAVGRFADRIHSIPWGDMAAKSPLAMLKESFQDLRAVFRRRNRQETCRDEAPGQAESAGGEGEAAASRLPVQQHPATCINSEMSPAAGNVTGTSKSRPFDILRPEKATPSCEQTEGSSGASGARERETQTDRQAETNSRLLRSSRPYTRGPWCDQTMAAPEVALELWKQHGAELCVRVAVRVSAQLCVGCGGGGGGLEGGGVLRAVRACGCAGDAHEQLLA